MIASNSFETQLAVGAIASWLIQKAKSAQSIPWINAQTKTLNRVVSIVLAAATGVGITIAYAGGTLTITHLTLATVLTALWLALKSFVLQEGWYQVVLGRSTPPAPVVIDARGAKPEDLAANLARLTQSKP